MKSYLTNVQLHQYVNYIGTLKNALQAIQREAKDTENQLIYDIAAGALETDNEEN